ncbi:hypothetical protein JDV09_18875 [Mycobacterium sp. Y57]|uniref:hypothetical protein n=1 Tax=Mycolicibacterium xanthum TaxID=2796469 RepID=UPI001C843AD0|nr:hypothetical protein [Mycolicibacterium xanthum]MBX7434163.1 hypothetical protein [Mycolicibacterium xanthum]
MSRGPGTIQRAIVKAALEQPASLAPLAVVAELEGQDWRRDSVRRAWTRAADRLYEQGQIGLWTLELPVSWSVNSGIARGDVLCVSAPDVESLDDGMLAAAAGIWRVLMFPIEEGE